MTTSTYEDLDRSITFYVTSSLHRETVEPIAEEARNRGFEVTFTDDFATRSEIGIYCQHSYFIPTVEAKLSIIMLHGLDMGYSKGRWPQENWSRFDIGLLPGTDVAENWRSMSHHRAARPKIGTYVVGWPKSDFAFSEDFQKAVDQHKSRLDLPSGRTVLYAPTKELAGKTHDFVDATRNVADALLIKHAPYESASKLVKIYEEYEDDDDVYIVDKDESIMHTLATADVLVSDQSSVLQEAAITDTVPISVTDWPIRQSGRVGPSDQIPDFATRVHRTELEETVNRVFSNHGSYLRKVQSERRDLIENPGSGAAITVDLIESVLSKRSPPCELVEPKPLETGGLREKYFALRTSSTKPYHMARHAIVSRMSDDTERRLKKLGIHKGLYFMDKIIGYKKYR